jgi:hypothetical protein
MAAHRIRMDRRSTQVLQLASRKLSASGHRAILEPGELRLMWPRSVSRGRGKSEPETFGQLKLRSEPVQLPRLGVHSRRLKLWPNVGTAGAASPVPAALVL